MAKLNVRFGDFQGIRTGDICVNCNGSAKVANMIITPTDKRYKAIKKRLCENCAILIKNTGSINTYKRLRG